jgi:putative ABC transport system permease protein
MAPIISGRTFSPAFATDTSRLKLTKEQHDVSSVIAHLKTKWASLTGNEPFTYSFMEEDIRKIYESDQRWMNIIGVASFSAILIACLGLFGLSAIISISRTKEIGIRKILGAEIAALYLNLNKGTLVMIGVSVIIALPIAHWIATNWLRGFAYRIQWAGASIRFQSSWQSYVHCWLLAIIRLERPWPTPSTA